MLSSSLRNCFLSEFICCKVKLAECNSFHPFITNLFSYFHKYQKKKKKKNLFHHKCNIFQSQKENRKKEEQIHNQHDDVDHSEREENKKKEKIAAKDKEKTLIIKMSKP